MASSWSNATGRPLSSFRWLESHHRAKFAERAAFARRLADLEPTSIVDIGCGPGLWLELFNDLLPDTCEFVGIDGDELALDAARERASRWSRRVKFVHLDFETDSHRIPPADLTLAFNVFPYVSNLPAFLEMLAARTPRGRLAVRQYDGGAMRFGPIETAERIEVETSLHASVGGSDMFRHYDMDRVFEAVFGSPFENRDISFELFQRIAPYPEDFLEYYKGTLTWTRGLVSERAAELLDRWTASSRTADYFLGVDLVAVLS